MNNIERTSNIVDFMCGYHPHKVRITQNVRRVRNIHFMVELVRAVWQAKQAKEEEKNGKTARVFL